MQLKQPFIIPPDLTLATNIVYANCNVDFTLPEPEPESAEYGACTFRINYMSVKFRVSKITPTKPGQFVTLWQRRDNGPIEPFNILDGPDLIIISARKDDHLGQFIFPKSALFEKGIISGKGKEGKRGIRIYPPWDKKLNKQAAKTQEWQLRYFLNITADSTNLTEAIKLLDKGDK